MLTIQQVKNALQLEPHPEGGFFKQTFADANTVAVSGNPTRPASTMIYFLLTPSSFSQIHRLDACEGWHHYAGLPIDIVELDGTGARVTRLGNKILNGELPQYVVAENTWFGSVMSDVDKGEDDGDGSRWSLVGCTVAPGFDWTKFEMGDRARLLNEFENCKEWIERLTH